MGAWLWAHGYGRMVMGAWLWAHGYGRMVMGAWLWVHGYGRMVMGAWLWAHGYGRMVMGAWLWAHVPATPHVIGSSDFINGDATVIACRNMETTILWTPQRDGTVTEGFP